MANQHPSQERQLETARQHGGLNVFLPIALLSRLADDAASATAALDGAAASDPTTLGSAEAAEPGGDSGEMALDDDVLIELSDTIMRTASFAGSAS